MTQITSDMLATMHARRLRGESCDEIARSYGLKSMAVYQRLRRKYGLDIYKIQPDAASDNNPKAGRVTKYSAHNGGCSTLSGMVPVTLVRIPTIDGPDPVQVQYARVQREQVAA